MRSGLAALAVAAALLFGGCSAPPQPIAAEVAQELKSEVEGIAVLTARGDTADAVAAAHALAARVRTAQTEGKITGERAIMILDRVEQLIERLVRSGAAPAPADVPELLIEPTSPDASPSPEPEPTETDEPTEDPEPSKTPDPGETPEPAVPEPTEAADGLAGADNSGSGSDNSGSSSDSGSGSGSLGSSRSSSSSGSASNPAVQIPVIINEVDIDDDDGGKGRGRGRSSDD